LPRILRKRSLIVLLAVAVAAVALIAHPAEPSSRSSKPWIGVKGNKLVDRSGDPVRLLGVNRPGLEYECVEGTGFFDGPTDPAAIAVMKRWHINVVRVPLNESCWLGQEWLKDNLSRGAYREAVHGFVERLEQAGLYVILDLQWSAPGSNLATGIIPMPSEHAPQFWREVASEYVNDRSVIFDLYNEPHDIDWECWESGCEVTDKYFGTYPVVGMRELVEAVRSTGARQPIMLGGLEYARDLSGWLEYRPPDPAHALVASNHTYEEPNPCYGACRAAIKRTSKVVPVVTGEIGEDDCNHSYISNYMRWADRNDISYLGWAWYIKSECKPSLIENYAGKPTALGLGLREHLRLLHSSRRSQ
jgi:endoglucanase